jgi:hypothetical protein
MATKEAIARVESLGMVARPTTAKEFGRFMHSELEMWSKVVKESGAKPE